MTYRGSLTISKYRLHNQFSKSSAISSSIFSCLSMVGSMSPRRKGALYLISISKQLVKEMQFCQKMKFPVKQKALYWDTHFPSTMLNSPSQMGKHPHPTTLSVAVTLPLRINSSKTRIMPGRTSGLDGQTVNTLWSIWKQSGKKCDYW